MAESVFPVVDTLSVPSVTIDHNRMLINSYPLAAESHSLFKNHELMPENFIPQIYTPPVDDWITIVLLIAIIYYTALFLLYGRWLNRLIKAVESVSISIQMVRDENISIQRVLSLLSLGFFFTGSVVLSLINEKYKLLPLESNGLMNFFLFLLLLAIVYPLKMMVVRFFGLVYKAEKLASHYNFQLMLFNNAAGVAFVPLLIFHLYFVVSVNIFLWVCIVVFALGWCSRLWRGVHSWLSYFRYPLHYLFFYICALEIAPLLMVIKML
jgi:hypothetical protein